MKVFVTGATGFIGSYVVQELLAAGHEVLGLARSDHSAQMLKDIGADVQRGDLADLESLRNGCARSQGVIHTAFNHDFSKSKESAEVDRKVIETLGVALAGTKRRLVVASGLLVITPNRLSLESDPSIPSSVVPRGATAE